MTICRIKILLTCAAILFVGSLEGCAGEDYTPVYFPPKEDKEAKGPSTSESQSLRQCSLSFTSQLCVALKGGSTSLEVGLDKDDALCAEVGAFPIHISGNKVKIIGNEFPDIKAEGHGLPAPIIINARGDTDGTSNVGEGTIDSAGNMTIEHFSLFIVALGQVGKLPNLNFTTGTTDELPDLPQITGSPPDASGAMKLVTGTVLGSTIEAADKYLMGASLTAEFSGSITPLLAQCGAENERSIEVKKITITKDGKQSEVPLPDNKYMDISGGTYIAEDKTDIGEHFEASARFRIKNIGNKPQDIKLPPKIGPFYLRSIDPLMRSLKAGQSFILDVMFRPAEGVGPGKIGQSISIGGDQFILVGKALAKSGEAALDVIDNSGVVTLPDIDSIDIGGAAVAAGTMRAFFLCTEIACNGNEAYTSCSKCNDPTQEPCELLPISTSGKPIGEVDSKCRVLDPQATPLFTIDLKGSGSLMLAGHKQVLAIRNKGVSNLKIKAITLKETAGSKSTGQFSIPENAIFKAKKFSEISTNIARVLAGESVRGEAFPLDLPPFYLGWDETSVYVVVTYTPNDLIGADGRQAGVGSPVRDKAIIRIQTDRGDISTVVTGTTTIKQTPALELYFRTSTGTKALGDGDSFAFRGATPKTTHLAYPLFLRVSDTAPGPLRVTTISIEGEDAAHFKLLDTTEKIQSVKPESGKGLACSIPIVDEETGEMTGEIFDLKPKSLEPPGFTIAPSAYSTANMPFFGCVDFYRDDGTPLEKKIFEAKLTIEAEELDVKGIPAKNPDGSIRKTTLNARLITAINPRTGPMVFRVTQTAAAILNPDFPGLSSIPSRADLADDLASGRVKKSDLQVFLGAMILDPFDEEKIISSDGLTLASKPNDGITAVFRSIDTHPVSINYDNDQLFDYASLIFDWERPEGSRGLFEGFPNIPPDLRTNGWRIFTSTLSYPGPIGPANKKPNMPSSCAIIDPCSAEGQRRFTDSGIPPGEKGACAFFYTSGGHYEKSPAFHPPEEMDGGDLDKLCNRLNEPQKLADMNTGHYTVDGRITFEDVGLRFFGPTFFHNRYGAYGSQSPLDEIFHIAFTTGILKPSTSNKDLNVLPDKKINLSKNEFKMNLTDESSDIPTICKENTKNQTVRGKAYSSWRFLENLLFKDEEGKIPAGCPDDDNKYQGGWAYLRGRDLNHESGAVTFVATAKFGSSDDLSFLFKDVMMFIMLNGWLCDPNGNEENFEGKHCYDLEFNDHDARDQISIVN